VVCPTECYSHHQTAFYAQLKRALARSCGLNVMHVTEKPGTAYWSLKGVMRGGCDERPAYPFGAAGTLRC